MAAIPHWYLQPFNGNPTIGFQPMDDNPTLIFFQSSYMGFPSLFKAIQLGFFSLFKVIPHGLPAFLHNPTLIFQPFYNNPRQIILVVFYGNLNLLRLPKQSCHFRTIICLRNYQIAYNFFIWVIYAIIYLARHTTLLSLRFRKKHVWKVSGLFLNSGFWGWLSIECQPQNPELGRL